ncbi:hypothetical protein GCM10023217_33490 [Gordonia alkaliphila]|uniref:VWFA domain-containing protein n=2 Tax=Gordonia alkaliphila TaxID=1053547 RepID=A0ABP8ZJM3_9ACTN
MASHLTQKTQSDARLKLPIYFLLDTSTSMQYGGRIDAINSIPPAVRKAARQDPVIDAKTRFCYITMNDTAQVVAPLAPGGDDIQLDLEPKGLTNYTAAFELLRKTFIADFHTLNEANTGTHRPVIIFITDGEPTCDATERKRAFDALMAVADWAPRIVMFGVGPEVTHETLDQYTGPKGFSVVCRDEPGRTSAEYITTMLSTFIQTVVDNIGGAPAQKPLDTGTEAGNDDVDDPFMHAVMQAFRDDDLLGRALGE